MNTQENNRLIAEFLGMELGDDKTMYYDDAENLHPPTPINELKFHSSWDWLMPVVDKIEREHKANFRIKCTWNEFTEHSIHQVIVNIEQGEMSKDKSCIYDSKKIYDYVGDAVKCKREATYKAVVEFIKQSINQ
tara:strand:+ start:80 stop:481 length:402 start_codon:yes stop_codon:yes gene_type:complete